MRFSKLIRSTASFAVLAAFATAAHAQTSPTTGQTPAVEEEEEPSTVDEIIVTAQKREQSLQDVPVVVTSLSEQILEDAGVRDIRDLQILTPGLTVTSTQSETSTTARIRGVGTVGDNPGLESSVGIVIDGVYRPRNGVGFADLGELERIEVLKGPQGTLFGRNTSAGVINVITKEPEFDFGADGELTVGNFELMRANASVTGPITENLAGRLYFGRGTRGGFYTVRTGEGPRTEREDQDQDFWTTRGQLLLTPNGVTSVRVIGDYTKRDENCCVGVQILTGPTSALVDLLASDEGVRAPARPFDRVAYSNRGTEQQIEDMGVSVEVNTDLPWWGGPTFTSITAARRWESVQGQDVDFTSADVFYRPADGTFGADFTSLSQEFRLAGSNGPLDWLIGSFFVSEDLKRTDTYVQGADTEAYFSAFVFNGVTSLATRPTNQGGLGLPLGPAAPGQNALNFIAGSATAVAGPTSGGAFPNGGRSVLDRFAQDTHSLAFFTHNIFRVTDQFDVTLGLRYTMEEKELLSNYSSPGAGTGCAAFLAATQPGAAGAAAQQRIATALVARGIPAAAFANPAAAQALIGTSVALACLPFTNPLFNGLTTAQEREENELTGTVKATYRLNDDFMTYASYARGYKSGGFNLDRSQSSNGLPTGGTGPVPVADTSFPAEFVDSYELGAKTTWLDGSLLLNATLFHQKFEDFQLNTFLGTTFVVESIPEVTSKGVDADFVWFTPLDGLTLQGGVTYAKTEYGQFTAADLTNPARFIGLSLLPGQQVSFAPEFSGSVAGTYERELGGSLVLRTHLSAKYMSEYNTASDLLAAKQQEAYTLLNGRIAVGTADERWTVELFAQNITDEEYLQVGFNAPLQGSAFPPNIPAYNPVYDTQTYNAFLGAPRTYGVTLRIKY